MYRVLEEKKLSEINIGNLIHAIDRKCSNDMKIYYDRMNLTVLEVYFLTTLIRCDKHEMSLKDIECYLAITQTDVTRTSRKLEEKGYIEKYADPTDFRKRRVIMRLTDDGVSAAEELLIREASHSVVIDSLFTDEERDSLHEMLVRIYNRIKNYQI